MHKRVCLQKRKDGTERMSYLGRLAQHSPISYPRNVQDIYVGGDVSEAE